MLSGTVANDLFRFRGRLQQLVRAQERRDLFQSGSLVSAQLGSTRSVYHGNPRTIQLTLKMHVHLKTRLN
jgi:hypothetical protein